MSRHFTIFVRKILVSVLFLHTIGVKVSCKMTFRIGLTILFSVSIFRISGSSFFFILIVFNHLLLVHATFVVSYMST